MNVLGDRSPKKKPTDRIRKGGRAHIWSTPGRNRHCRERDNVSSNSPKGRLGSLQVQKGGKNWAKGGGGGERNRSPSSEQGAANEPNQKKKLNSKPATPERDRTCKYEKRGDAQKRIKSGEKKQNRGKKKKKKKKKKTTKPGQGGEKESVKKTVRKNINTIKNIKSEAKKERGKTEQAAKKSAKGGGKHQGPSIEGELSEGGNRSWE